MLLKEIWAQNQDIDLVELAGKLGSDVPMCLDDSPKRVTGTGQITSEFALTASLAMVLVNPNIALATPAVFEKLQDKNQPPISTDSGVAIHSIEQAIKLLSPLRNDLQPVAIELVPQIGDVLTQIKKQPGCL